VAAQRIIKLNAGDVARVCGGELVAGDPAREAVGVSIDSRSAAADEMFVAIEGDRFDGHDFADAASEAGASLLVVARDRLSRVSETSRSRSAVVAVPETLHALHALANAHRLRFAIPLIAVTGSCGKTTVKEMVSAVAAQKFHVAKSRGNFNNEIGLPLSLFEIGSDTELCVVEMGINAPGELTRLCAIAEPTAGIITNIGRTHLEGLGSVEKVAEAKGELAEYLAGREGTLFISADDQWCRAIADKFTGECVTFGEHEGARVRAVVVETGDTTRVTLADDEEPYVVHLPGKYMGLNALAAIAVGCWLDVTHERIQAGLEKSERLPMRMAVIQVGNATVIDDSYNANPESVGAALDVLAQKPTAGLRIAVLGDMKELGEAAAELHRMVGTHAVQAGVDLVVAVGEYAEYVVQGACDGGMAPEQCMALDKRDAAVGFLVRFIFEPNVILIKGSRAARMDDIVDKLLQASGQEH